MPPYGVAIRSFLKMLKNGTFRMRIPTPVTSVTHYKFLATKEP